jgi:SPP1 gp7 family putative phage head morphogenesis protein
MMGLKDAWRGLFKKQTPPPRPTGGEIGATGNKIFAGLPMDEYNPDLAFPESVLVYDRMRRSDGQIAAIYAALTLPIRSTKWYIEPCEDAEDQQLAEQIAKFVEDNLFGGMQYSWDEFLREALLMLIYGFSVFEKVWRFDTWNGRPVVWLDKYAPRVAPSIWRFPQDENSQDIVAVEQIIYTTGDIKTIPLSKCRIFTYQREGNDPVGISAFRPAYKHWYIKDALYNVMAVGIEKQLVGTPYAKVPQGTSEDEKNKILDALTATRTSEEAGFTVPDNVQVDMLQAGANNIQQLAMAFLEHQDTLIARSVLAQFINLGTLSSASGGSYALGQTMVDLFCMSLEAVARYIEGEVQHDIEELVTYNWGADAPMPRLQHKHISFNDMSQVAQALYWLGAGHLMTPDEDTENFIREMFGIPPIPESAQRNQRLMPPDKFEPMVVPEQPLSPEDIAEMQKAQQAYIGAKPGPGSAAMHEHEHGVTFTDDSGTPTFRRELNDHERRVDVQGLHQRWTQAEQQLLAKMREQMRQYEEQVLQQVQRILQSNATPRQKMARVNALQVRGITKYAQLIQQEGQLMYEYGVQSVAKETQTEAQAPPTDAAIAAKAETLAALQTQKLLTSIQISVVSDLAKGLDTKRILYNARTAADSYINGPDLQTSATITIGEDLNIGRGAQAKAAGVIGGVWSAVLDSHTCPLCEELDGKVIRMDDPDFDVFRPPVHPNCRCFWIYIPEGATNIEYTWHTPHGATVKKYGSLIT